MDLVSHKHRADIYQISPMHNVYMTQGYNKAVHAWATDCNQFSVTVHCCEELVQLLLDSELTDVYLGIVLLRALDKSWCNGHKIITIIMYVVTVHCQELTKANLIHRIILHWWVFSLWVYWPWPQRSSATTCKLISLSRSEHSILVNAILKLVLKIRWNTARKKYFLMTPKLKFSDLNLRLENPWCRIWVKTNREHHI